MPESLKKKLGLTERATPCGEGPLPETRLHPANAKESVFRRHEEKGPPQIGPCHHGDGIILIQPHKDAPLNQLPPPLHKEQSATAICEVQCVGVSAASEH
ncbi:hypothetical protein SKAU_G00151870 [Synaphobranchus kaupii]|uniref:Uncharacterized protein n=1 Tax=Synaphobranchus kaupii TaxID=118154 RepID=A0A9Q1FH88_SYNKA|nr:hypothetical protein SKAU_G00151870 [Synaphobranchus kaupii]